MFASNVAPKRRMRAAVKRVPWACKCPSPFGEAIAKVNPPGLKRCLDCLEMRP